MNANSEFAYSARLVESLTPWLDQVVIIGGLAHRLHRLHPLAQPLQYEPLATLDADIALPRRIRVAGDEIYQRLAANGFEAEFLGHHRPPSAHYRLTDPGIHFYAEFLTPLVGGAVGSRGNRLQHRGWAAFLRKTCAPNRLYRHRISPYPSYFVDPTEQSSSINGGCGERCGAGTMR
jgi:Nucleotidyltransferase